MADEEFLVLFVLLVVFYVIFFCCFRICDEDKVPDEAATVTSQTNQSETVNTQISMPMLNPTSFQQAMPVLYHPQNFPCSHTLQSSNFPSQFNASSIHFLTLGSAVNLNNQQDAPPSYDDAMKILAKK